MGTGGDDDVVVATIGLNRVDRSVQSESFPEVPLELDADDRAANPSADRKAKPVGGVGVRQQEDGERAAGLGEAVGEDGLEVPGVGESVSGSKGVFGHGGAWTGRGPGSMGGAVGRRGQEAPDDRQRRQPDEG